MYDKSSLNDEVAKHEVSKIRSVKKIKIIKKNKQEDISAERGTVICQRLKKKVLL